MYKPPLKDMSIKVDKEEQETADEKPLYKGPQYPWGLAISLREEELEKLGLDFDSVEVGETIALTAKTKVTSLSSNESEDGAQRKCVELQITHLGLNDNRTSEQNKADGRYKDN